jgi:C_GCAxxG_C_C family probable redox protein
VVLALGESLGIESELIPRIATGFHGGVGGSHRWICGALSGEVIAAGIAFGREKPRESAKRVDTLVQRLLGDFEGRFGSVRCYELVGIPYEEENWSEKWRALNMRDRCLDFVQFMVGRLLELAGR